MNNLIFCLNATVPIFFLILLGMFLRKIQLMDDAFTARLNTLVFRVCLPALLFHDMYRTDYRTNWNTAYVVYCALATLAGILICTGVSYLLKDRSVQGEFIQTSYRSSATILGIAVVQNLYHNVGMAPLMVIGAVPIYNIAAVIILEMYRPDRGKLDAMLLRKTLHGILTNPIILSILLGFAWSLLRLPLPTIGDTTVDYVGRCATPLGIIAMGASFQWEKARQSAGPALVSTFIKLFGLCALFLPLGVYLGFRNDLLVAALVMCGSSTTISCFVMAKGMGHKGDLTISTVMLTTLLSAFSLTFWLFILKSHGWI
ncbi:MAG: AEC family transporter [Clostridia bacterium]